MKKEPCAYFEGEIQQGLEWFARALSAHLRNNHYPTKVFNKWFIPGRVIEIDISGTKFVILLSFQRKHEWRLVFLFPSRSQFASLRHITDVEITNLQAITQEVHLFLSKIPDMSGLRWYLKDAHSSVSTPDELSWG